MPTSVASISASSLTVRYKEPFLSEGLNTKLVTSPPGIYRGFRMVPAVAALSIDVESDPDSSDSVAVFHNAAGNAVGVRMTGTTTLNLSASVSKTVVVCIYGQYSTTQTTAAEFRTYELSPVDEFTVAPEKPYLIVLGTVEVPGAGAIPADNVSSYYRTNAGDATSIGLRPRVPLIQNPFFGLADATSPVQPLAVENLGHLYAPVPGWYVLTLGQYDYWQVVADATNYGSRVLQFRVFGGTGTAAALYSLPLYDMGELAADAVVDVELEYEVLVACPATDLNLDFVDNSGVLTTKTLALDVSTPGITALNASVVVADLGMTAPIALQSVWFDFTWAGAVSGTDYLKLRKLQIWAPAASRKEGGADPDPRTLSRYFPTDVGASALRLADRVNSLDPRQYWDNAIALTLISGTSTRGGDPSLTVHAGDGTSATHGVHLPGVVTAGESLRDTGANYGIPRFHAKRDATSEWMKFFEAQDPFGGPEVSLWVGPAGEAMYVQNAHWNSGTSQWTKDQGGSPASAARLDASGMRLLYQNSGTGNWADTAWRVTGGTHRGQQRITVGNGSTTFGDVNGANGIRLAIDAIAANTFGSVSDVVIEVLSGTYTVTGAGDRIDFTTVSANVKLQASRGVVINATGVTSGILLNPGYHYEISGFQFTGQPYSISTNKAASLWLHDVQIIAAGVFYVPPGTRVQFLSSGNSDQNGLYIDRVSFTGAAAGKPFLTADMQDVTTGDALGNIIVRDVTAHLYQYWSFFFLTSTGVAPVTLRPIRRILFERCIVAVAGSADGTLPSTTNGGMWQVDTAAFGARNTIGVTEIAYIDCEVTGSGAYNFSAPDTDNSILMWAVFDDTNTFERVNRLIIRGGKWIANRYSTGDDHVIVPFYVGRLTHPDADIAECPIGEIILENVEMGYKDTLGGNYGSVPTDILSAPAAGAQAAFTFSADKLTVRNFELHGLTSASGQGDVAFYTRGSASISGFDLLLEFSGAGTLPTRRVTCAFMAALNPAVRGNFEISKSKVRSKVGVLLLGGGSSIFNIDKLYSPEVGAARAFRVTDSSFEDLNCNNGAVIGLANAAAARDFNINICDSVFRGNAGGLSFDANNLYKFEPLRIESNKFHNNTGAAGVLIILPSASLATCIVSNNRFRNTGGSSQLSITGGASSDAAPVVIGNTFELSSAIAFSWTASASTIYGVVSGNIFDPSASFPWTSHQMFITCTAGAKLYVAGIAAMDTTVPGGVNTVMTNNVGYYQTS